MILKDDPRVRVELKDNLIHKEFKKPINHLDEDWYNYYKKFVDEYGITPKIYEGDNTYMIMEKIEGEELQPGTGMRHNEYIYKMTEIFYKFSKFSYDHNCYLFHLDLNISNIIVNNNEWKVIDPDSITIYPVLVSHCYYKMIDKPVSEVLRLHNDMTSPLIKKKHDWHDIIMEFKECGK